MKTISKILDAYRKQVEGTKHIGLINNDCIFLRQQIEDMLGEFPLEYRNEPHYEPQASLKGAKIGYNQGMNKILDHILKIKK